MAAQLANRLLQTCLL